MKILQCLVQDQLHLALKLPQGYLSLSLGKNHLPFDLPMDISQLINNASYYLPILKKLENSILSNPAKLDSPTGNLLLDPHLITFLPPISHPEKILCIGLNYASHSTEIKMHRPDTPVVFSKFNNTLVGHNTIISIPPATQKLDHEAELVIIIGKEGKNISYEKALDYVFGYTIGNDLSARDLQFQTSQWLLGKTCDHFAPLGPWIIPAAEIDPQTLQITCKVNQKLHQIGNTKDMIFDCKYLIQFLSQHLTLRPMDIIFTGTPSGVIQGRQPQDQHWLTSGDSIEIEISDIGILSNTIK